MYIVFDTETTGLPIDSKAPLENLANWPRVVQIAWQLHDLDGTLIRHKDYLIRPEGFQIPYEAEKIHGISTDLALAEGEDITIVLQDFVADLERSVVMVGHNLTFDIQAISVEFLRLGMGYDALEKEIIDTCTQKIANICQLQGGRNKQFKLPTLGELYLYLFGDSFSEAHNATADVEATARCFFELYRRRVFSEQELFAPQASIDSFYEKHTQTIELFGLVHESLQEKSKKLHKLDSVDRRVQHTDSSFELSDLPFAHLHNHTQFSVLQSTTTIDQLVKLTAAHGMPAVAITDTSNMMGAFQFERAVSKYNKQIEKERQIAESNGEVFQKSTILPIIGCELHICRDMYNKSTKDNGYQVVLLAKNKKGYQHLIKLSSLAHTDGMYYVPRIDKNTLLRFKDELIVLTGSLNGVIPGLLLNQGEGPAEESLLWWKEHFGEDLYIELMRHGDEKEEYVNPILLKLARKHNVKVVATNNTFYLKEGDADAHDVLLCVKDNNLVSTPKGVGRGFRFGYESFEYYFKSADEMKKLFADIPEAITHISEIIGKCEPYELAREVLLPAFDIPDEFRDALDRQDGGKRGENNYLRHLTYEGAKARYPEITSEIRERIDFELATIENTGYPGYFLIVQDFCRAAREMGVSVGPGRGSAAGSVVAYCTGITNVDPIAYDLLFERFLNPDRVSMPDIDIDFDDEGRGKVIEWVINKYGSNQVAQIITYGTMAAKSSIRDTARVLDLPLPEADRLAKLVPDISLKNLLHMSDIELTEKLKNNQEEIAKAKELRKLHKGNDLQAKVIQQASMIEGSLRNTGIHACGVIITPGDITDYVPVATAKDSSMFCTQFDNSVAESAGLLKMDFLGLKTLTLIKDAVRNVREAHGVQLEPDEFPIDDVKTYELFQRGETVGIFQYESPGMQKCMKELKPTVFADLIAMNALYRPGPLDYIPSFIKRKHGEEQIEYDVPECEEYLKETYGITVYQEQVMLLSQKLAGFSKGEADTLRKAMGKKQREVLDKMKPTFLDGGRKNGHDVQKLEKIWKDWEAFASYAFNKSHSTCYAWVAYQTAFLKANYPAEYMASVLSNNMSDLKQITFFMEECRRMGLKVLGPDVNESKEQFTVNKDGAIRFGLGAIRGLGSSAVRNIVSERDKNGPYASVFDLVTRNSSGAISRSSLESIVLAGGLDSFGTYHRAQFFHKETNERTFADTVLRFAKEFQHAKSSPQQNIFSDSSVVYLPEPAPPQVDEWTSSYKLKREKEVVGIYLSGHPLDDYALDIKSFCNSNVGMLQDLNSCKGRDMLIPAIVMESEHRFSKNGSPFGTLTIEDYSDSIKLFLWRENYLKYKHFMEPGTFIAIRGKVEASSRGGQLEFSVANIELLQNLRDKKSKAVQLKVPLKSVTTDFISELNNICMHHPGGCMLQLKVYDYLEGTEVNLISRTTRISPDNQFFSSLSALSVDFEILT
jgi:DNA polymerase-3 subunit alpha